MANILEGKTLARTIREDVIAEIRGIAAAGAAGLTLCAVQFGDDCESELYVDMQKRNAAKLGINYVLRHVSGKTQEKEAVELINELNADSGITGIILQRPIPKHLDACTLINHISPVKDVEGMHPENIGRVVLDREHIVPCTPCAVMELIKKTGIDLYGKEAVVVGHSDIVGKPLAMMLLNKLATVTVCHIATAERGNLAEHVRQAEVLVAAVGKAHVIKGEWVRPGSVVIDVGINCENGMVTGDVEFESAAARAGHITPVPGGVGPLTVALLMRNVVKAAQLQRQAAEKGKG